MHYNSIIHIDSLQNMCSTRPVISLLVQSKLHCVLALTWFIRHRPTERGGQPGRHPGAHEFIIFNNIYVTQGRQENVWAPRQKEAWLLSYNSPYNDTTTLCNKQGISTTKMNWRIVIYKTALYLFIYLDNILLAALGHIYVIEI
jgi:hypothetical protein